MFGRFDDVTKSRAKLMKVEVYACLVVTTWLGYPKVGDGSIYVLTYFTS